jgi:hypothetical protein
MVSRPNWACSVCGMDSGRKESVQRHINNRNIHNGYGTVIPFADSLIARQAGLLAEQNRGKGGFVSHFDTGFEQFKRALPQKIADKMAEKIVFGPFGIQPSYQPSREFYLRDYFKKVENLFAIEAGICQKCSAIEPITHSYTETENEGRKTTRLSLPCYPLAGLQPEQGFYQSGTTPLPIGLVSQLKSWLNYVLPFYEQKKIVALRLPDPEPNNGTSVARLFVDRSVSHFEQEKYITLNYSAKMCQELIVGAQTSPHHWSSRVIENGSAPLTCDGEVMDYLLATNISTYGFFRVRVRDHDTNLRQTRRKGGVYLIMLLFNNQIPTILETYSIPKDPEPI